MAYADGNYSKLFVSSDGTPLPEAVVPESCIQAAEYIIQSIKLNAYPTRLKKGADVMAAFGNVTINITKDDFLGKDAPKQPATDYAFKGPPALGQGVMLLNKTSSNLDYNMHLGTVVAVDPSDGHVLISNMMEKVTPHPEFATLRVIKINSAAQFATTTMGSLANKYAVGLLYSS